MTKHDNIDAALSGAIDSELVHAFRRLKLRIAGDGSTVTVDTSAVANPHGVHCLLIERDAPDSDLWHHYPSGVSGPLAEILIGIAWSYVRFPDDDGIGYQ